MKDEERLRLHMWCGGTNRSGWWPTLSCSSGCGRGGLWRPKLLPDVLSLLLGRDAVALSIMPIKPRLFSLQTLASLVDTAPLVWMDALHLAGCYGVPWEWIGSYGVGAESGIAIASNGKGRQPTVSWEAARRGRGCVDQH